MRKLFLVLLLPVLPVFSGVQLTGILDLQTNEDRSIAYVPIEHRRWVDYDFFSIDVKSVDIIETYDLSPFYPQHYLDSIRYAFGETVCLFLKDITTRPITNTLVLFDANTKSVVKDLDITEEQVADFYVHLNRIFLLSSNDQIIVLDLNTLDVVQTISIPQNSGYRISGNQDVLVVFGNRSSTLAFDIDSLELSFSLPLETHHLSLGIESIHIYTSNGISSYSFSGELIQTLKIGDIGGQYLAPIIFEDYFLLTHDQSEPDNPILLNMQTHEVAYLDYQSRYYLFVGTALSSNNFLFGQGSFTSVGVIPNIEPKLLLKTFELNFIPTNATTYN